MAIDRLDGIGGTGKPGGPGRSEERPGKAEKSEATGRDRVEVSGDARRVSELARKAAALPEVRQDKIDSIREAVEEGTYEVRPRHLARAILEFEDGLDR